MKNSINSDNVKNVPQKKSVIIFLNIAIITFTFNVQMKTKTSDANASQQMAMKCLLDWPQSIDGSLVDVSLSWRTLAMSWLEPFELFLSDTFEYAEQNTSAHKQVAIMYECKEAPDGDLGCSILAIMS